MKYLKILAEYIEPFYRFKKEKIENSIVFFGSARIKKDGPLAKYYLDAYNLSHRLTKWSHDQFGIHARKFVICTGGGTGIMEAANKGAFDANGITIGLNIKLPYEQQANLFITPTLAFDFHYFFIRKFWFAKLAVAIIIFPGGFGTLDELTEVLTLIQSNKIDKNIPIIMYGTSYWKELINFDTLVKNGMVNESDLDIIYFADEVEVAFNYLTSNLHSS